MNISKSLVLASMVASLAVAVAAQSASSSIANLSSLGSVGQNAGNLIAAFVIEGTAPKHVLVRGTEPSA